MKVSVPRIGTYAPKAPSSVSPLLTSGRAKRLPAGLRSRLERVESHYPCLALNPFASQLASPLRYNPISRQRVPSAFLLPMALVREEESAEGGVAVGLAPFFERARIRTYAPNHRVQIQSLFAPPQSGSRVLLPAKVRLQKGTLQALRFGELERMEATVHAAYVAELKRHIARLETSGRWPGLVVHTPPATDHRQYLCLLFSPAFPPAKHPTLVGSVDMNCLFRHDKALEAYLREKAAPGPQGHCYLKLTKRSHPLACLLLRFTTYNEI